MLLSSYLNLGILFLATANALVISDPHATEASCRHQQQQISTPALQKRSIGILPWKRQAPATEPEEGSEDLTADGDGSIPQGKSNSWLGDWWDNLKLNPFAKDGTEEEPEEGGGFFAGLFGSNGKEEKPPKEKEQKQPSKGIFGGLFGGADKSEQEPKSSSGSWFKNPFGGGSNPDPEPESSSGSWFKNPFGGGSNNNGASGEDNSRSTAVDPDQGPSRGFDESVGMNTQLNRPPMSSSLQPTSSGTDSALMQLNRASRRRLKKYDTKEQQRIDTLRLNRQPIPTDDPSLLVIANPVERLKAYDARRDRQRQDKMRSDQAIKNQKGSLSQDEQRLLNNYDQLETAQNPNSRILAIKDSRERLTKYKLRDKNKKPLTSQEQQRLDRFDAIEKQNPSSRILKTADPRNRLQRYEQREAQRQKNAAAKNKGQPASGQRYKLS
ncbi:hypothetical protein PpBr36_04857 [Pyricularia pennisetigena]|uniref:hypothetical protein n=1 Tax=Pyricularia pennisetigena TaxID=1578925 RepID=UPI0011523A51|nr:hypothetical protein PpBr36_04857 [Pyricularia pennisetigena]TLS26697.1 hypothetical protein PpBr36_04857 [Pyricularia pennisetigena]